MRKLKAYSSVLLALVLILSSCSKEDKTDNVAKFYAKTTKKEFKKSQSIIKKIKPIFTVESSGETVAETMKTPRMSYGYLSVTSNTEAVRIEIDGWPRSMDYDTATKGNFLIGTGKHYIAVKKKGFGTYMTSFSIAKSETTVINVNIYSQVGSAVKLKSEPSGARVYVDDFYQGETPLDITDLSVAEHSFVMKKQGYFDWNTNVDLKDNMIEEIVTIEAKLEMKPGEIHVNTNPEGATLYFNKNEKVKYTTPAKFNDLAIGRYYVTIFEKGFEATEKHYDVGPGEIVRDNIELIKRVRYEPLLSFGKGGVKEFDLKLPVDITVDWNGNIFVTDAGNHRVVKYDANGKFLSDMGGRGEGKDEQDNPDGSGNGSGTGKGQFNFPKGIAIDNEHNIYVTDSRNHRIQKFSSTGKFLAQFGKFGSGDGELNNPSGIAAYKGFIYVAENGNNRVQKFNTNGRFISKFGSKGHREGQFNSPEGICIDDSGNIFVVDWGNSRVEVFSQKGEFIRQFGTTGGSQGEFLFPTFASIDGKGLIYVSDSGNNRIQRFKTDGTFEMMVVSTKEDASHFPSPQGIAFDKDGFMYVVQKNMDKVVKFSPVWDKNFIPK